MNRRRFLETLGAGATALSLRTARGAEAKPPRPNIVVMLSDDMAWGQPGFQGGKVIATPHLDRLTREGVSLTQFYVQPVCTPTRSALLTGRYPFRTGTVIRFTGNDTAGMLTDERTLADALRDAGYHTGICGKWHLGEWQKQHLPRQRGFHHQYGHYSALIDSFTHTRNGVLDWHRNEQPLREEGYSSDLIAAEVERLILRHDAARPFFIYVPFNAVHGPHQAPPDVVAKYRGSGVRNPAQAAQLECMDRAVGRILAALDRKGVRDDTLVVFFNDNGGPGMNSNRPYRGGKSAYLEGGMRVACLLRWPGKITAGSTVDEPLHVVDLFPTFVTLAGGSLQQPLPLDGLDAWPTIAEGKPSPRTEIVHGLQCIRVGDWKYIGADARYYNWTSEGTQLYHTRDDPGEQRNLADKHPDKLKELQERLRYWATQARPAETHRRIPGYPPLCYGEQEHTSPPPWLAEHIEQVRGGGKDATMRPRGKRRGKAK